MSRSYPRLALVFRWAARASSLLSIGVLLLFMFGEDGLIGVRGWDKWLGLLFFPFGVILGLGLAWWREALGAAVAAASLMAFYASQACFVGRLPSGPWFLIFTSPAILFFASWLANADTMR